MATPPRMGESVSNFQNSVEPSPLIAAPSRGGESGRTGTILHLLLVSAGLSLTATRRKPS